MRFCIPINLLAASLLVLGMAMPMASCAVEMPSIIPMPAFLEMKEGVFALDGNVPIVCPEQEEIPFIGNLLADCIRAKRGIQDFPKADGKAIQLMLEADTPPEGMERDSWRESYSLSIAADRIQIKAPTVAGLFYGAQTLMQIIETSPGESLPCLEIIDAPNFPWRGLMMDCSRTFWSVAGLKRWMDLMALYKLNVFHLHLTDDQGWRVEIRSHPELTSIGARFTDHYNEPPERQGFYSQDDIRELVEYARLRHINIVPEIEMPGHATAFLATYPDVSCTGGPFEVFPFFKGENITADVMCAGNEKTFEILEDVMDEVIELFPSRYIHIGGDEVPKTSWNNCSKCQARIARESLKDADELQSYFISRMAAYIQSKGREVIGWDEILEGGLAKGALVMSWRGIEGGIKAAEMGHCAVMSPVTHCYFDYPTDKYTTANVYAYQPVPKQLEGEKAHFVLGAQGNMWTHIARTEKEVDQQIFPRLIALSEVVWTPNDKRSLESFLARLKQQKTSIKMLESVAFSEMNLFESALPPQK